MRKSILMLFVSCTMMLALTGCVRAARNTEGFEKVDAVKVDASFEQTWQTTKAALREQGYEIYTRDKRGVFVAFTKMHRAFFVVPRRIKYTVSLTSISESVTELKIETVKQVYGVTLLTYPTWHDRRATDNAAAREIIAAVQAKLAVAASQ